MNKYILKGKNPVECNDVMKWARWFESANRIVKKTDINKQVVSTVFLGLNHNYDGGKPLLFETMVFPECDICERYTTWDEAEKGHNKIVEKIKNES